MTEEGLNPTAHDPAEREAKRIKQFYETDDYISKHPSLHEEDSPWKLEKILPLVDVFLRMHKASTVHLLDTGGGAGVILRETGRHISGAGRKVVKSALDLSPGMLEVQKRNNPDLTRAISGDIAKMPFVDKDVDLMLLVDVLEHVPNPDQALREVSRIAQFALLKVPLDKNLFYRTQNFFERGRLRDRSVHNLGHVNAYSFGSLKRDIERHGGEVVSHRFTNAYRYALRPANQQSNQQTRWGRFENAMNTLGSAVFVISPRLASLLFNEFVVVLSRFR